MKRSVWSMNWSSGERKICERRKVAGEGATKVVRLNFKAWQSSILLLLIDNAKVLGEPAGFVGSNVGERLAECYLAGKVLYALCS